MLDFGNLWWSAGFYFRVTDVDHKLQPESGKQVADQWGNVWFRMIVGLSF
jgi:hypothetical protein